MTEICVRIFCPCPIFSSELMSVSELMFVSAKKNFRVFLSIRLSSLSNSTWFEKILDFQIFRILFLIWISFYFWEKMGKTFLKFLCTHEVNF